MNYPQIVNSSLALQANLNNITWNSYKRRINGKFLFDFKCYEEALKTEYILTTNMIKINNYLFDINYINIGHSTAIEYDVSTEHISYRLIGEEVDSYAYSGTPTEVLTNLLSGTDFTVGTVDLTDPIIFAVNKKTNKLNILYTLANQLNLEIDYNNFTISLLNTIGQDNNYRVEIKKNLKEIHMIQDKRGTDYLTYTFDVVNIFESEELKTNFKDLETVDIGDTVYIKNSVLNIDTTQAVYEIEKDIIKNKNINITTGDNFNNLADSISYLQETAIKQTDIIYGVKINNEVGIEIERPDLKARSIFNADEFKMQVGDGAGNYTDAIYFDTANNKYIFVGEINVSSVEGLGDLATKDSVSSGEIDTNAITETKISSNAVTASKIEANAVTADKISVNKLSAIDADLGTITAGTIIGTTFKTSNSGKRLQINDDDLNTYNSSNNKHGIQIEAIKDFSALTFYNNGTLNGGLELAGGYFSLASVDVDTRIMTNKNISLSASDILINGDSINYYNNIAGNGIDLATSVNTSGDVLGTVIKIDPSEIAGDGLQEDSSENLEVDFSDVPFTDGQSIEFQVVDGNLEYRLSGGSFTALANY